MSSTNVTSLHPDQRLKSSYHFHPPSKHYIISLIEAIVSANHYHQYTSTTYTCSENKSHIHHDNQSKPPLCAGKHLQNSCSGFVHPYHYRYSTWTAQNSGTPKRSSPWLYQWCQNLHVQDLRWSCAARVSDLLRLFCVSTFACVWTDAEQRITAKYHAPDAKAPDSWVPNALLA